MKKLLITALMLAAALSVMAFAMPNASVTVDTASESVVCESFDEKAEFLSISGSGTVTDPFLVVTEEDLMLVSDFPDCHFKLANDIALTSTNWEPLCVLGDPFSGIFDGNGYTISNLRITTNRLGTNCENGLFSVNAGTIKNLNVETNSTGITGCAVYVGVLAGNNKGTIQNCTVSGKISLNYDADSSLYIGGLAGYNTGNIEKCYSSVYIFSDSPSSDGAYRYIGGLVGRNVNYGSISKCFYNGSMDLCGITSYPSYYAGGLVGEQYSTSSTPTVAGSVTDSAAIATINNSDRCGYFKSVSGLVGQCETKSTVSNCYAVVSGTQLDYGLTYYGKVTNSFYDKTVSGKTDTSYGTPKSTAAMKMSQTYTTAGWDFENTWAISEDINNGYPYLQWMYETTYKVTYDANGGEGAPDAQRKYEDADLVLSDVVPTRDGYKFLGWATSSDANSAEYGAGDTYSENAELTLYAVWEKVYYITYNANGGMDAPETQVKEKNKDITLPVSTPVRVGYKFLGWATQADATEAEYLPGDTYSLNSDIDLYAVWEKLYVITYDFTAIPIQYKEADVDVNISSVVPSMELRAFLGWATSPDSDVVEYAPGDVYSVNADLNLYAVWKNLYVDILLREKLAASNVRYYEIDGNQYEIVENNDNTLRIVPEKNMVVEIVEKQSASSVTTERTEYYYIDSTDYTCKKLSLSSFISSSPNTSVRLMTPMGIRFKSFILNSAKFETEEYVIEEYGFIMGIKSQLDAAGAQLNFGFSKVASGVAFDRANRIDKVFDSTDDEICVFTGVLKNIPESQYQTVITSKTYTKINVGGETFVLYGEPVNASIYEVAKSALSSDVLDDEARAELQKIVTSVEGEPDDEDEMDNEIYVNGDDLYGFKY